MDDPRVKTLSEIFVQTLSTNPDVIRQAEAQLQQHSLQPGFGIALLKLIATDLPEEHRLAPAVNFKNFIKANWAPKPDSGRPTISDGEKEQIKALLITLMLSAPARVRAQLSEALVSIGQNDYPAHWPRLLPELLEKLQLGDSHITNGVLETTHSIYKRYRNQVMTEALSKELEYSQVIIKPLLQTLETTKMRLGEAEAAQNVEASKLLLSNILLICKIFFSLNSPGLTEAMEETLDAWMKHFHDLLNLNMPQLTEANEDKESVLDAVKGSVCDTLVLFMELNEEEFAKYVDTFTNDVWNQLAAVTDRPGQDHLAMSAMHFLTGVAKSSHSTLFQGAALEQICQRVVVPNIRMREDVEDIFHMNYMEYIQLDTEGSDSDTRRRAATELVKALTKKFPVEVTQLFLGYVNAMLQGYRANPAEWKAKDCAVYLTTALTVHGKTVEKGATLTNEFVNIPQFFLSDVQPDLAPDVASTRPFLTADALRFVSTFRSQIPKPDLLVVLPHIVQLLTDSTNVIHSYAAITIEQLLSLKVGGVPAFSPEELTSLLLPLFTSLFGAFSFPESEENPYLMKCVLRVIIFTGPQISAVAATCLQELARLLLQVAANPKQPQFAHYLFESIAAIIKHCPVTAAEERLFPAFNVLLQQDVQEFHPYVFQILSQLIDERQPPLPPIYLEIFPPLLTQFYWERKGNIPALVRLLQSYLAKAGPQIVEKGHLQSLLGVFQKLVSTKAHDHEGFYILNALIESLPPDVISPFLPKLWGLLFDRLQNSQTPKFVRSFIVFMSLFICKHGVVFVASSVDAVQAGLFVGGILQQVFLPHFATITGRNEAKLVSVALTKVLFEYPPMQQPQTAMLWGQLLQLLLKYIDSGTASEGAIVHVEEEVPEAGYAASYARLVNSGREPSDPLPGVIPKEELSKLVNQFHQVHPGMLAGLLQAANTAPEVRQQLQAYSPSFQMPIA